MSEGGYDTASFVQTVYQGADTTYGPPKYWIRYFSPSPNHGVNYTSANAVLECRAVYDSGAKHLSPLTSPSQSRLSGTYAAGQADAQAFVTAMQQVYGWVVPLQLPSNLELRVWLDQEAGTSMSASYWQGWSEYLDTYEWLPGEFLLYPCLYCNPCGGSGHNCTTVVQGGACYGIWSSEPESPYCGYNLRSLPGWHANACTCATGAPATVLWQFAEAGTCGLSVNIDMDEGTLTPYSFYLSARP